MTKPLPVSMLVLLSRRASLPSDAFSPYWQDVHGPMAARLEGPHHYRQLHLQWARGWWPEQAGIDYEAPAEDRVDGIADMAFLDADGLQRYRERAHLMMEDEPNVFGRSLRYLGDAETAARATGRMERAAAATPPGPDELRLCLLLKRHPDAAPEAFSQCLDDLSQAARQAGAAWELWTLQERDNTQNRLLSVGVDHDAPLPRQYQAMVELAFADALAARRFFQGEAFAAMAAQRSRNLAALHAYRIGHVAPMLLGGRVTLDGLHGHGTARLIRRLGALNQLETPAASVFSRGLRTSLA